MFDYSACDSQLSNCLRQCDDIPKECTGNGNFKKCYTNKRDNCKDGCRNTKNTCVNAKNAEYARLMTCRDGLVAQTPDNPGSFCVFKDKAKIDEMWKLRVRGINGDGRKNYALSDEECYNSEQCCDSLKYWNKKGSRKDGTDHGSKGWRNYRNIPNPDGDLLKGYGKSAFNDLSAPDIVPTCTYDMTTQERKDEDVERADSSVQNREKRSEDDIRFCRMERITPIAGDVLNKFQGCPPKVAVTETPSVTLVSKPVESLPPGWTQEPNGKTSGKHGCRIKGDPEWSSTFDYNKIEVQKKCEDTPGCVGYYSNGTWLVATDTNPASCSSDGDQFSYPDFYRYNRKELKPSSAVVVGIPSDAEIKAEQQRHWGSPPTNNTLVTSPPETSGVPAASSYFANFNLDFGAKLCPPSFQWDQNKGQCLAACTSGPSTNRTKELDFGGPGWCIEDKCADGFYAGTVFSMEPGGQLVNGTGVDAQHMKNKATVCYPSQLACPSGKTFDRLSLYCSDQPVPKANDWGVFYRV